MTKRRKSFGDILSTKVVAELRPCMVTWTSGQGRSGHRASFTHKHIPKGHWGSHGFMVPNEQAGLIDTVPKYVFLTISVHWSFKIFPLWALSRITFPHFIYLDNLLRQNYAPRSLTRPEGAAPMKACTHSQAKSQGREHSPAHPFPVTGSLANPTADPASVRLTHSGHGCPSSSHRRTRIPVSLPVFVTCMGLPFCSELTLHL